MAAPGRRCLIPAIIVATLMIFIFMNEEHKIRATEFLHNHIHDQAKGHKDTQQDASSRYLPVRRQPGQHLLSKISFLFSCPRLRRRFSNGVSSNQNFTSITASNMFRRLSSVSPEHSRCCFKCGPIHHSRLAVRGDSYRRKHQRAASQCRWNSHSLEPFQTQA